jgi:hypothetical protein
MSSGMYTKGMNHFFGGDIDFVNDEINAVLVDTALVGTTDHYAPNRTDDETIGDIPDDSILSETSLSGKYIDAASLFADSLLFTAVADEGKVGKALVIFRNGSSINTSYLIAIFEDDKIADFPFTPDGSNLTVPFPVSGIGGAIV